MEENNNKLASNSYVNLFINRHGHAPTYSIITHGCQMNEHDSEKIKTLLENIVRNKGDIILSYRQLYIYILDMIEKEENKDYFEKIFLNMNYDIEIMFTPNFNEGLNVMLNQIDITKLNIPSKFSLSYILDIIESVMMNNIVKSYKRNLSREKNIEIFEKELALVCAGILKK